MCGIGGIWNYRSGKPVTTPDLRAITDRMIHRGPDDEGFWSEGDVGLGFRRLSIIDLAGGHQPMSNETGSVWLVFNGEIYNFQPLREELRRLGHRFSSNCDSEVIVHAYEEYGVECLQRLDGMFAFAIWDRERQRLLLARDRIGKKPLIYANTPDGLVFGSEIHAVMGASGVSRAIRPQSLIDYLNLQYVPSPSTICEQMYKLPPAHYLIAERGNITVQRYWSLRFEPDESLTESDAIALLREAVKEAVRARLVSDVPLGAFLSGGIDSTIVVGIMSRLMAEPVETFSIGFAEQRFNELPFAREVANRFGTNHHEFIVQPDMVDVLPKLALHYGEPFGDGSALPTYFLAQQTRNFVTVALSGDGGDEVFAGYYRHNVGLGSTAWDRMPGVIQNAGQKLAGLLTPARMNSWPPARRFRTIAGFPHLSDRYRAWILWKSAGYWTEVLSESLVRDMLPNDPYTRVVRPWFDSGLAAHPLNQMLLADSMTSLPDDILVKVDIASMANSLEVRCPLLDRAVIEFGARLPVALKLRDGQGKHILRRAFAELLPPETSARPKQGFEIPFAQWLGGDLHDMVHDLLLGHTGHREEFSQAGITNLLAEFDGGETRHSGLIWALLILEQWYQQVESGTLQGAAA